MARDTLGFFIDAARLSDIGQHNPFVGNVLMKLIGSSVCVDLKCAHCLLSS